jgi:hypothetical protein
MDFDAGVSLGPIPSAELCRKLSHVKACFDYRDDWFYADLTAFGAGNGDRQTGILFGFEFPGSGSPKEYFATGMEPE